MTHQLSAAIELAVDPTAAMRTVARHTRGILCDDGLVGTVDLHVRVGTLDLARTATMVLDDAVVGVGDGAAVVAVAWYDATQPRRYPVVTGAFTVEPVPGTPQRTQLRFDGEQRSPMGAAGALAERAGTGRAADQAVAELVGRVAERLRAAVARDVQTSAEDLRLRHLSAPRVRLLDE